MVDITEIDKRRKGLTQSIEEHVKQVFEMDKEVIELNGKIKEMRDRIDEITDERALTLNYINVLMDIKNDL